MRKYRSYKFTNKKHSADGVRSSIAAAIALICTVVSVSCAYLAKGEAGKYLVILAVAAIIGSVYGLLAGRKSFREEECYYLFSYIGTGVNMILVVFWIAVVALGILA